MASRNGRAVVARRGEALLSIRTEVAPEIEGRFADGWAASVSQALHVLDLDGGREEQPVFVFELVEVLVVQLHVLRLELDDGRRLTGVHDEDLAIRLGTDGDQDQLVEGEQTAQ